MFPRVPQAELDKVRQCYNECKGNVKDMAEKLGVSRQQVYNRLSQLKLKPVKSPSGRKGKTDDELRAAHAKYHANPKLAAKHLGFKNSDYVTDRWRSLGLQSNGKRKSNVSDVLWENYWENRNVENRNALAMHYDTYVQTQAFRAVYKCPESVDKEGAMQEARIRLLEAIEKFDGSTDFKTFSTMHIRGGALDAIREQDPVPRLVRVREKVRKSLEAAGIDPLTGMSKEHYADSFAKDSLQGSVVKVETDSFKTVTILDSVSADSSLSEFQRDTLIRELMTGCSLREQTIFYLYYIVERTMKEVGAILFMSESRASQIHSAVMERLRSKYDRESITEFFRYLDEKKVGQGSQRRRTAALAS